MSKTVLTLIASAGKKNLTAVLVTKLTAEFRREGALHLKTEWLAESSACDITLSQMEPEIADAITQNIIGSDSIDFIAQYTDHRQKRLLISDMDSTIITVECIDEIADFAGVKEKVACITERAMRGEIDFPSALRERVMLLKGLEESLLQTVYTERVKLMPGARELVLTMRAHGAHTMLVSGGFDFFTSRVAHAAGFHSDEANRLEIRDGKLTGQVVPPILDKDAKLAALMCVSAEKTIPLPATLAVGDGANDLPMIMAAGLGVAYHAKPIVQHAARARINHGDLTALLFAQGYRREEFSV